MTLSNKKEKRLQTLMRKLTFINKATMDEIVDWSPRNTSRGEYYEVYYLAELKGWAEDQLKVEWTKAQRMQWYRRKSYRTMPRGSRRDNKDVRVGSGSGGNINSIRFPRVARKTAWKRFWKLFPALEGCYNLEDYYKKRTNDPEGTMYPLWRGTDK